MSKRSQPPGTESEKARITKKAKVPEKRPELKHPAIKRAHEIDEDPPYEQLIEVLGKQEEKKDVSGVAHWFRSKDLRIEDNKALYAASQLAKREGKPLITIYLDCPPEFEWHGTSPARCDFIFEALKIIQKELETLNIPLVFLTADKRSDKVPVVLDFLRKHNVSHVFANYEYEVDEIRRDIKFIKHAKNEIQLELYHDQTVVEPGMIQTGTGKAMKVFTPYHKTWLQVVKGDPSLLNTSDPPTKNKETAKKDLKSLFSSPVPKPPKNQEFASDEDRKRIRKLWPAGHDAGMARMADFIKKKIAAYAETRSDPSKDSSSRMSAYFSSGMVSVREVLLLVKAHNKGSADFSPTGASAGVSAWVREIVFRELYRQTTVCTPHVSMNLPMNLRFIKVQWEEDEEGWKKWCEGRTGVPFVDAGMRQLNTEAYMHNRLRMNTASYLRTNLLIDYRRGERYFANHLIDWDMSNNTQGWEPSYTVFSPTGQAEKNDPLGNYIRKWVPELRNVAGKAVFEPHTRLSKAEFEKLGYPRPHVDWNETKARCMERYKSAGSA